MNTYMVERNLAGISQDALGQAQAAAIAAAADSTAKGHDVRYVRTTFAPGDGRCFCMFEAQTPEHVAALNDAANLPYDRVTPAMAFDAP